jgi:hypothetical protein
MWVEFIAIANKVSLRVTYHKGKWVMSLMQSCKGTIQYGSNNKKWNWEKLAWIRIEVWWVSWANTTGRMRHLLLKYMIYPGYEIAQRWSVSYYWWRSLTHRSMWSWLQVKWAFHLENIWFRRLIASILGMGQDPINYI